MTQQNIKRRTLVKGAAWAAPAVAASASVPAYAASRCVQGLDIERGYWQGVYYTQQENKTGDLYTTGAFGKVTIPGLKPGVTVKKITSTLYFKRRTNKTKHEVGTFSPSESYTGVTTHGYLPMSKNEDNKAMVKGKSYPFYDLENGITNSFTFLGNDIQEVYYPDTEATNSWAVQNVWSAENSGKTNQPKESYTLDGTCNTFYVNLGKFLIRAQDVYIGSQLEVCNGMISYLTHSIELTDGTSSWTLPLSVAKGQYKDGLCTNWKTKFDGN